MEIIAAVIGVLGIVLGFVLEHFRLRREMDELRRRDQDLRNRMTEAEKFLRKIDLTGVGKALYYQHQWADCIDVLTSVIERDPNNGQAHLLRGRAHGKLRDNQRAVADLKRAVDLLPQDGDAEHALAASLFALGAFDRCALVVRDAISHGVSNEPDAFTLWGDALRMNGDVEDALHIYEDALLWNERHTPAIHGKGLALMSLGRFGEAIEHFENAYESNPTAHSYLMYGALARFRRNESGDRAMATAGFEEYRRRNPGDTLGYARPALALIEEIEQAEQITDVSVRNEHLYTALDLLDVGIGQARRDFRPALRNLKVRAYLLLGEPQQAIDEGEKGVRENNRYPQNFMALCTALLAAGRWQEAETRALEWLNSEHSRGPSAGRVWLRLFCGLARVCAATPPFSGDEEIAEIQRELKLVPGFHGVLWPAVKQRITAELMGDDRIEVARQMLNLVGDTCGPQ